MLQAADIDRAAATLQAMAAIPCLRGGILNFDENLKREEWREDDGAVTWVWVQVPDGAADFAECRVKIEVAIDEARRGICGMINDHDLRELDREWRAEHPEDSAPLDHYFEKLERLEVAA